MDHRGVLRGVPEDRGDHGERGPVDTILVATECRRLWDPDLTPGGLAIPARSILADITFATVDMGP